MEEALGAIEQLGVVQALKTSFFAYPVVNALHILAIGALVTTVILMDLKLLGLFDEMPEPHFIRLLRRIALGAFVVASATGLALFSVRASEYAAMPLFWAKMGLIGLAALNFIAFITIRNGPRRVFALVSITLWPLALLAGRFLGFVL
ncbi:hypothetical protein PRN20_00390 [Devosia sp. ZB163]|uniref:hypothetical protein n=1 Tax=Devosia sp. ZB163 TaxID=3025938 RepID=UPI00236311E5|nr:hypothetical protein [Devosia sp. ZB163]MDC9822174.1 hypothetical protein [Devosia sp. ZB163]